MADKREVERARALVGRRVTAGQPGTDDYDHGKIVNYADDGRVQVAWEIAGESYWEHPAALDIEGES